LYGQKPSKTAKTLYESGRKKPKIAGEVPPDKKMSLYSFKTRKNAPTCPIFKSKQAAERKDCLDQGAWAILLQIRPTVHRGQRLAGHNIGKLMMIDSEICENRMMV
jgi:hypothetical protein